MGRTLRRAVTLAAGLAAVVAVAPSSADAVTCTATAAVSPVLRAEGLSEPVGDIVVVCPHQMSDVPTSNGANVPLVNVTVFFNTTVSSRVLATGAGGAPPFFSEALLVLDEAGSGDVPLAPCQTASGVCQNKGNGLGSGYYVGQPGSNGSVNVFQGTVNPIATPSMVTFSQVPLDPPASGQTRVLRITNLRANANAIGSAPTAPSPVIAVVSISSVPLNSPQQTLGFVQVGHTAALRDAASTAEQATPPQLRTCDQTTNVRVGTLRFTEVFATAFRQRNPGSTLTPSSTQDTAVPGLVSNTETMFFSSSLVGHLDRGNLGIAGLPDAGTRLAAHFEGVPPGVRLFVDTRATPVGSQSQGAWLTPGETGGFLQLPGSADGPPGAAEVALAGGRGQAVWEVTAGDPNAAGSLDMGVYATYPAGAPTAGTANVAMGLAPGMDAALDSRASPGPVPRFDSRATTQRQLLQLVSCPGQPGGGAALTALRLSRSSFPAARRGGSIAKGSRAGARVRYTLSAPATVRFFVERRRTGRPRFKRLRGRFQHSGKSGSNSFRFTGRLRRRALPPGRYRLVGAPVLAGGTLGPAKRVRFRIVD